MVSIFDTLDDTDMYILDLLGKDGRVPAAQISEQLKVKGKRMTSRGVTKRLKRLEHNKIILDHSTILNPAIFTKKTCRSIFLKIRSSASNTGLIKELNNYVRESSFCLSITRMYEADFDYLCEFVFESEKQCNIEIKNFLYIFKDLLSQLQICKSRIKKFSNYRISFTPSLEERREMIFLQPSHEKNAKGNVNLQEIVDRLTRDFEVNFSGIWLLDGDSKNLALKYAAGTTIRPKELTELSVEDSIAVKQIIIAKEPVNIFDVVNDGRIREGFHGWAKNESIKSFAGYPLMKSNRVIGMLALFGNREISLASFDLIETFLDISLNEAIVTN